MDGRLKINGKAIDYQPRAKMFYDVDWSMIILKVQWTAWKYTIHYNANG